MNGKPNHTIWPLCMLFLLAAACPTGADTVIYVDADSTGVNIGSSWTYAINSLQDALLLAYFLSKPVEIRVAQGIYTPDRGLGIAPGDREASFQLMDDVTVRGGYAGFGELDPDARDIELYETILSGDLDGNDGPDFANNSDNSYHVVTCAHVGKTAVLDGVTITGSNAGLGHLLDPQGGGGMRNNESSPTLTNCTFSGNRSLRSGGGMYNYKSSPKLTNCTFSGNHAGSDGGGGMYNDDSDPMLVDCTFSGNSTTDAGGGMYNMNSNPTLLNCIFSGNTADWLRAGGGMYNHRSNPELTNCTFSGNSANQGGGMYNLSSSPMLADCAFIGNSTRFDGGGMYNEHSFPVLLGCKFSENSALKSGGGMYNGYLSIVRETQQLTLTNCIFSSNSARHGGGIANEDARYVVLLNCTFSANSADDTGGAISNMQSDAPTLVNCILWGNTPEQIEGQARVSYSDVEGGFFGEGNIGNIDVAPVFADPDNGDYHLRSQAGRWDPTSRSWVVDKTSSPCIDAGSPDNPTGLERFPNGGIINMGAYGGTPEASLSPRQLPRASGQASNPDPADGAIGVEVGAITELSWTAGMNAVWHNVYFGTSPILGRAELISERQTSTTYRFYGDLPSGTTFYWRIDEISSDGTITTGEVWTFTTYSGPKGRSCFTGETDVWVEGVLVQISKAAVGQTVGKITCLAKASSQIEKVEEHEGIFECYDVLLETGDCITVASSHYFLTDSSRWVAVQDLGCGSKLQSIDGQVRIRAVVKRAEPFVGKVYNLKIKGADRYLVGKDRVIVRDY